MKNTIWVFLLSVLAFASCGDDTEAKKEFKDGVIVVNQGLFQTGTGTLTFKERGSSTVVQDLIGLNNEGAFLGNIAQSMIEHNGKNYISINNGGNIIVTHKDDFTILDTISGIFQSRYFASNGDNLFVSAWGENGISGSVQEIDTDINVSQAVLSPTNFGPEGMLFLGDILIVAESGGFGLDSVVLGFDIDAQVIVLNITVGDKPESIVKDNENNMYVICNGYSDFIDPTNNTPGKLVKIGNNNLKVSWSIEIPNGSNRLAIDADNGFLYFNMNGNVVKHDINSDTLTNIVVREGTAHALGFDDLEDKLYIGDAKDFASQGEVYVYSTEDVLLESFKCGIVPSYFHFK